MTEAATAERPYTIEDREVVAETPELRVSVLTLGPGQLIPWHCHSRVTDTFFCLEGEIRVETRAPRGAFRLKPGERCAVSAKHAHEVTNAGAGRARFLIVQGIGTYDYIPVGGAPTG
jgi:quercetin dioxygenase-like cupin family protein